jgi:hypothetical protein
MYEKISRAREPKNIHRNPQEKTRISIEKLDFVQNIGTLIAQNITISHMTTQYLTLSDYRTNISRYTREAQEKHITYTILIHSKPAFEVKPILDDTRELVYPV